MTLWPTLQTLFQILLTVSIISSKAKENPPSHSTFSCHVSLVSYINLEQFLRHSTCCKTRASNCVECTSIWVCLTFPRGELGIWQVPTEVILCSQWILSRGAGCPLLPLQVTLTLVTSSRCCLSHVSTTMVPLFLWNK